MTSLSSDVDDIWHTDTDRLTNKKIAADREIHELLSADDSPTSTCLCVCVAVSLSVCVGMSVSDQQLNCFTYFSVLRTLRNKVFVICRLYATVSVWHCTLTAQSLLLSLLACHVSVRLYV